MKVLIVNSGISSSTGDVYRGYVSAFQRHGHEVIRYELSARIGQANAMLHHAWKMAGKPENRPTGADVYYRASEGVLSFALRHLPDLVLVVTSQFFHPDLLVFLERAGFTVGIVGTESPYGDGFTAHFLQAVDCGWTQERSSVERLREWSGNPNVWYLPAAYDRELHQPTLQPDDFNVPQHDVVLVATAFHERIKFLEAVDWTGIDLGLYGDWRPLASRSKLRRFVRGGITDNRMAAALYRRAKIGLNVYRDGLILAGQPGGTLSYDGAEVVPAESLNPRAYELAACGCFQISQPRAEVSDIFGEAVPQVATSAELGETIREYLAKPERRRALAKQAQYAVVGHSFDARMGQMIEQVKAVKATTGPVALREVRQ